MTSEVVFPLFNQVRRSLIMNLFLATWKRKIASTFLLTVLLVIGGLTIDPSYLNNPIGEGALGVVAAEGYNMPATTELSFVADGVDPVQIDMKSEEGDFSGEIEVINPDGKLVLNQKFALLRYPATLLPNPAKWQTFMSRQTGRGTYLLRMTQKTPGKAKIFLYQGPFVMRMLILPLIAAFIMLVVHFTFSPKSAAAKTEE